MAEREKKESDIPQDRPGIGNPAGRNPKPETHPTPSDAPEKEPRPDDAPDLDQIPDEPGAYPDHDPN